MLISHHPFQKESTSAGKFFRIWCSLEGNEIFSWSDDTIGRIKQLPTLVVQKVHCAQLPRQFSQTGQSETSASGAIETRIHNVWSSHCHGNVRAYCRSNQAKSSFGPFDSTKRSRACSYTELNRSPLLKWRLTFDWYLTTNVCELTPSLFWSEPIFIFSTFPIWRCVLHSKDHNMKNTWCLRSYFWLLLECTLHFQFFLHNSTKEHSLLVTQKTTQLSKMSDFNNNV